MVKNQVEHLKLSIGIQLTIALILFIYNCLKWTYVLINYIENGVVTEGNIFLMFAVIPFGVLQWLAAMVLLFVALARLGDKDATGEVFNELKGLVWIDIGAFIVTLVELVALLVFTM